MRGLRQPRGLRVRLETAPGRLGSAELGFGGWTRSPGQQVSSAVVPTASGLPSWLTRWDWCKHRNHPLDSWGGDQRAMGQLTRLGPSLIAGLLLPAAASPADSLQA